MRLALLAILIAFPALGDEPQVSGATAARDGDGWRFDVTLTHPDTGWDHYADAWRIEAPDGTVLGLRELAHPHVDEQPFTRSLSGITLPEGVTEVRVRARCLVDGWAEQTFALTLP